MPPRSTGLPPPGNPGHGPALFACFVSFAVSPLCFPGGRAIGHGQLKMSNAPRLLPKRGRFTAISDKGQSFFLRAPTLTVSPLIFIFMGLFFN